jgi:hypothetical protein
MLFNNSSAIEFPQFAHILTPNYNGFFAKKQIHCPEDSNHPEFGGQPGCIFIVGIDFRLFLG